MTTNRPTVVVTRTIPAAGLDLLERSCDVRLWEGALPPAPEELRDLLTGADGALTLLTDRVDAELLNAVPGLRVVSNFAVGYDNIDVPAATERGVAVCNTPDVLTETTAEFAFALMMAAARRIPEGVDNVRSGAWRTWGPQTLLGQDVVGATIGIVGFGRIGQAFARLCQGFSTRILVHHRHPDPGLAAELGVEFVTMDELLAESDIVSLHVPLTKETHHLIDRAALDAMKPTAILVNSARGLIVDHDALVEALSEERIFAAALDVTDPEPLPADHPLVALPNCLVVPHIASATVRTRDRMALIAAENILHLFNGTDPPAVVNPEVLKR